MEQNELKEEYLEVILNLNKEDSEKFRNYLDENEIFDCLGFYEVIYDEGQENIDLATIHFYFLKSKINVIWEIDTILLSLDIDSYELDIFSIENKDYWEDYKKSFSPIRVSQNFYVIPDWLKNNGFNDQHIIPIYIKLGLAFGTGFHESTQLMLQWVDVNVQNNWVILDAGTGSGILSIAALKKNADKVYAFDIDENALIAIQNNLRINQIEDMINQKIFIYHSDWENQELMLYDYNVILANMTLPVFLKYHKIIKKYKTSKLIVSGITNDQKEYFLPLFDSKFELVFENQKNEWLLLELKSKS